jgi:riboflavin synthase
MFTGIIERTARVTAVEATDAGKRLSVDLGWSDLRGGESVAVNGVCLTVSQPGEGRCGFDVIPETLSRTNLGLLKLRDEVHVERALRIGDRLDGHFVQGHVDGTAKLITTSPAGPDIRLTLEVPAALGKFLSPKGSVTLDGVSLTIAAITGDRFQVALIPTTLQRTLLGRRPIGWPFNFEADILAKTVIGWLERRDGKPENTADLR